MQKATILCFPGRLLAVQENYDKSTNFWVLQLIFNPRLVKSSSEAYTLTPNK